MAAAEEAAAVRELLRFLRPEARADVRAQAAAHALGLTGSAEGRALLGGPGPVRALLALSADPAAGGASLAALLNLAAEPGAAAAAALAPALPALLRRALEPAEPRAEALCHLLCNAARAEAGARALAAAPGPGPGPLVEALCAPRAAPHALAPLLANLSRLPEARRALLQRPRCMLQRLLPFTQYEGSAVRRRGVVGTIRNCCFEHCSHEWLLSDEVDILPFLLLPLAGPEELPEEEMERLPVDLQYLPPEKQREKEPDIRKMLLETIMLLTATKPGRCLVKEKGTYLILRELHRWEPEPHVRAACEKLIQVLIGDEPGPGMENLLEVTIPAEVEAQLQRLDREEEEEEERRCQQERSEELGAQTCPQGPSR